MSEIYEMLGRHGLLELGGGVNRRPGFVSVDVKAFDDMTIVWDLEEGLPLLFGNRLKKIVADNVLEHINNLIYLMNSCYHALESGGTMEITVPLANTKGALKDPTHVRHFIPESFDYFDLAWDYPRQPDYGIMKWHVDVINTLWESEDYQYIFVILRKP